MIAIQLQHLTRPDLSATITFGCRPDDLEFRVTYADADGPSGHTCRDTWQAAVELAYREGYTLVTRCFGLVTRERAQLELESLRAADEAFLSEVEADLAAIKAPA